MDSNQPLSEQFRLAAEDWRDKEAAAKLLESTREAWRARKMQIITGSVAAAKRDVEASDWYMKYVEEMLKARGEADKAWVGVQFIQMQFQEWQSAEANRRAEMRL